MALFVPLALCPGSKGFTARDNVIVWEFFGLLFLSNGSYRISANRKTPKSTLISTKNAQSLVKTRRLIRLFINNSPFSSGKLKTKTFPFVHYILVASLISTASKFCRILDISKKENCLPSFVNKNHKNFKNKMKYVYRNRPLLEQNS